MEDYGKPRDLRPLSGSRVSWRLQVGDVHGAVGQLQVEFMKPLVCTDDGLVADGEHLCHLQSLRLVVGYAEEGCVAIARLRIGK